MINWHRFGGIALAFMVASVPSMAERNTGTIAYLRGRYEYYAKAFRAHDLKGATIDMAPDFVAVMPDGVKLSRSQAVRENARLIRELGTIEDESIRLSDVRLKGNRISVVVTDHFTVVRRDRFGMIHSMVATEVTRDTWRRTRTGWQMIESRVIKIYRKIDGHPA